MEAQSQAPPAAFCSAGVPPLLTEPEAEERGPQSHHPALFEGNTEHRSGRGVILRGWLSQSGLPLWKMSCLSLLADRSHASSHGDKNKAIGPEVPSGT